MFGQDSNLLYEGDYTEDAVFTVPGVGSDNNIMAGCFHHVEIYEDYLIDNNSKYMAKGARVYAGGMYTYQVDYDFSIIRYFTDGFFTSYVRFNKKGNVAYNINAPVQNNGGGNYNSGNYNSGSYNSGTSNTNNSGPSQVKCSYCNGTGKVAKNTYPPQFGTQDYKVRCPECGEEHWKSDGHVHVPCPSCNGRGYK